MKTLLITGGTSGIGLKLVQHFDREGYRVYFTARNAAKAEALKAKLDHADYFLMDFASLASVRDGAETIRNTLPHLDILINNAGTWQMEFLESQDGIELNFAVNHLAPMLLTLELLPTLAAAPQARIINTASGAHRRDILDLEDLEHRIQPYNGIATYSQSKLCNILFSLHFKELLPDSVTVNTVHPGYVKTALFDQMSPRDWQGIPTAGTGARSAIYAATAAELEGQSGLYLYLEQVDPNLSAKAQDIQLAQRLWDLSRDYLQPFLTLASPVNA